MECHYDNVHVYAYNNEITSGRYDAPPDRPRSNSKEVSETTSTQNANITKIDGKLRIVFSVTVVFFIVTLAVFGVLAYWISRLNIQDIEQEDQQSTNMKLIEELKNETKVTEAKLINMMNEQKDQQSTNLKLINELKNETRISDGNLINMMNDLIKKVQRYQGVCDAGISDGRIKSSQLSASSVYPNPPYCILEKVRLDSVTSWCAAANNLQQWVQVDFLTPRMVTGIKTRGRGLWNQYVTTYQVSYGNDAGNLQYYTEQSGKKRIEEYSA